MQESETGASDANLCREEAGQAEVKIFRSSFRFRFGFRFRFRFRSTKAARNLGTNVKQANKNE